jgi:ATP-dependent Lhr-like helicase
MNGHGPASADVLGQFHPAVSSWFRSQFGDPTPPQLLGWPVIAAGRHTLIVAPTGSGKTLAAFLAALDQLWRAPRQKPGVRILYISPLKALNQDVARNLEFPLAGITARADEMGERLGKLDVAVRSGDTPTHERARLLRKPPDILITTPESLHLMLTSRARDVLRGVTHVIVDEIHAVCGNKRGVFLALLLERLQFRNALPFVRIGLSATQRPLEEVARYLGGFERVRPENGAARFEPRPVTIIDAGWRRDLDLEVIWPRRFSGPGAGGNQSIWPDIDQTVLDLVNQHRSTIVFANNRRTVEKLTARLNDLTSSEDEPSQDARFRAHHGSISLEERQSTERALKEGELGAVVATASLELGIDMGAVDLVCQVESPGSVARGLQRVGRAGHVVRGVSKGRLIAKTAGDLLESAALCRAMLQGRIERLTVPRACLDVLAQQVIACVAMDSWNVSELFDLVRQAYPYAQLPAEVFESVLRLVSGRFPTESFRDLRARISWDPVHNRLGSLPGTARLALTGGGTIPDTGQYPVYLGEGGPRLGELDEEFVFERRTGETFMLGNAAWRIEAIEAHRVVVSRALGHAAVMPFWRGEGANRSPELGEAVGELCRELSRRIDDPELLSFLERECRLTASAARYLVNYVARQKRLVGHVPDDRTIVVESFVDPAGEVGLAVLTPFGGKLHHGLKLALSGRIRQRFGLSPACLHADDGLLFRLPGMDDPPLDVFDGLTGELADQLIREELGETALFGLRFRQNAGRALLMPRPDPGKRAPLWLQRLRSKDLLQVARRFTDFPIVVETVRECLDDDLELPRLKRFLDAIQKGEIRVVERKGEIPSPFTSELIFQFTAAHVYQWDEPKRADRAPAASLVDDDLLVPLLRGENPDEWLAPEAVGRLENRIRRLGQPPRTIDEMAERLRLFGDLTDRETTGPMSALLEELSRFGRALRLGLAGNSEPDRWVSTEHLPLYRAAFPETGDTVDDLALMPARQTARAEIVERFLGTHAMIGLAELTARYPLSAAEAAELLDRFADQGKAVRLGGSGAREDSRWAERENLTEMRRITVAVKRGESIAVPPEVFADFLLSRQYVHPGTRGEGALFVENVLELLRGYFAPATSWEAEILPARMRSYRPAWLDDTLARGAWFWQAGAGNRDEPRVAFFDRDFRGSISPPDPEPPGADATLVLEALGRNGASFSADLARISGIEPSRVHRGLRELMERGLITNDRFDPLRPGADASSLALAEAKARIGPGRQPRMRPRRSLQAGAEGRWSRLVPAECDPESSLLAWADVLFERYGVLTREMLALEPAAPPWAELAVVLGRAELRGEVRRGYFVEGLSGVQYALDETPAALSKLAASTSADAPLIMVSTLDPANIYGSGAPLDIELLEGGKARLPRTAGNYLVLKRGRPVLIIESHGKRLTGLAWASPDDIKSALNFLPTLTGSKRRILKVETYNGRAAMEHPGVARLLEIGFVRDYPGLAYYADWSTALS